MIGSENDTATQRERLVQALAATRTAGVQLKFWWRDDDAVSVTPQLEDLLSIRAEAEVPLALAVIPKFAEAALMDRLNETGSVFVLQHGWAHAKNSPAGEKASEFGESRPLEASLTDLQRGHDRLAPMAGNLFLPVLTPPWNRIGGEARSGRQEIGLTGLSVFGSSDGEPHVCNTHFDIIAWRTTRGFIGMQKAYALLADEIEHRLDEPEEPIGILTHHLVHDEEANAFLRHLFGLLREEPHVTWPDLPKLFHL